MLSMVEGAVENGDSYGSKLEDNTSVEDTKYYSTQKAVLVVLG